MSCFSWCHYWHTKLTCSFTFTIRYFGAKYDPKWKHKLYLRWLITVIKWPCRSRCHCWGTLPPSVSTLTTAICTFNTHFPEFLGCWAWHVTQFCPMGWKQKSFSGRGFWITFVQGIYLEGMCLRSYSFHFPFSLVKTGGAAAILQLWGQMSHKLLLE